MHSKIYLLCTSNLFHILQSYQGCIFLSLRIFFWHWIWNSNSHIMLKKNSANNPTCISFKSLMDELYGTIHILLLWWNCAVLTFTWNKKPNFRGHLLPMVFVIMASGLHPQPTLGETVNWPSLHLFPSLSLFFKLSLLLRSPRRHCNKLPVLDKVPP